MSGHHCVDTWFEPATHESENNLVGTLRRWDLPRDFFPLFRDNVIREAGLKLGVQNDVVVNHTTLPSTFRGDKEHPHNVFAHEAVFEKEVEASKKTMNEQQQAQFNGWARVEVMGHQQHIGYVRTEAYGAAVLFRVDIPELPKREYALMEPQYVGARWCPAGSVVQRESTPGSSVLVGAGSIYRICPCTEEAAKAAIDQSERAELKLISLPEGKALPAPEGDDMETAEDETDSEETEF